MLTNFFLLNIAKYHKIMLKHIKNTQQCHLVLQNLITTKYITINM